MRVGILMPTIVPWARQVAMRLCELGHVVHVIDFEEKWRPSAAMQRESECQTQDVALFHTMVSGVHRIRSVFQSGFRYFTAFHQLRNICRRCDVDVLLAMYGGGWGTMAYLSGVRPCAIYVVGSDVLRLRGLGRIASAWALNRADAVLVNGWYLASQTRVFAPRAPVIPLLIGVNTDRFTPRSVARCPLKVVCTRKFHPVYNNELLIRGLAELKDAKLDMNVTFTSPGPDLPRARDLAARLLPAAMLHRVTFLDGVSDDGLLENLQAANVFVSFARSDGTSTAMLEAMACGLFLVVSDIPQNREWVVPALHNGVLVPLDRPKAAAEALQKAHCSPDLLDQAAVVNRRLVMDRADSRKTIRGLSAHLESIVRARRK